MSAGISGRTAGVGAGLTIAAGAHTSGTGGDVSIVSGNITRVVRCTFNLQLNFRSSIVGASGATTSGNVFLYTANAGKAGSSGAVGISTGAAVSTKLYKIIFLLCDNSRLMQ